MNDLPIPKTRMLVTGITVAAGAAVNFACACLGEQPGTGILALNAIIASIASLAGNSLASDTHLLLDRPVPDPDSRRWNHDILRASVFAVGDIIKKEAASKSEATAGSLLRLADAVSSYYDEIDDPVPFAVVTEQELRDSLIKGEGFHHETSGEPETWTAFLHHIAQGIEDFPNISQTVMLQLGTAICQGFNNQLFQVLKFDFDAQGSPIKGRAYAAVSLNLLIHIANDNSKILDSLQTLRDENTKGHADTHTSLAGLHTKFDLLSGLHRTREREIARAIIIKEIKAITAARIAEIDSPTDWRRVRIIEQECEIHIANLDRSLFDIDRTIYKNEASEIYLLATGILCAHGPAEALGFLESKANDRKKKMDIAIAMRQRSVDEVRRLLQEDLLAASLLVQNFRYGEARDLYINTIAADDSWPEARYQYAYFLACTMGRRLATHGDVPNAESNCREALLQATQICAGHPDNHNFSELLYICHTLHGNIAYRKGDLHAAYGSYKDALTIAEFLSESEPENTKWLDGHIVCLIKLAMIAKDQGDLASAQTYCVNVLFSSHGLATKEPRNPQWLSHRACSCSMLGDISVAAGDRSVAYVWYYDALRIWETMLDSDPENRDWRSEAASCHINLGDIAVAEGNLTAACASYTASVEIRKDLTKRDQSNRRSQDELSLSYERLGDVALAQRDFPGALANHGAAMDLRKTLAQFDPHNSHFQCNLSISYEKLGDVAHAQGDSIKAYNAYETAMKIAQSLAQSDCSNIEWQSDLAVCHQKLGDVACDYDDLPAAHEAYSAALNIRKILAQQCPDRTDFQRDLAVSKNRLGDIAVYTGNLSVAHNFYNEGFEIARKLVKIDRKNTQWRSDLAHSYDRLSAVTLAKGDFRSARAYNAAALKIHKKLIDLDPENMVWQHNQVRSKSNFAKIGVTRG